MPMAEGIMIYWRTYTVLLLTMGRLSIIWLHPPLYIPLANNIVIVLGTMLHSLQIFCSLCCSVDSASSYKHLIFFVSISSMAMHVCIPINKKKGYVVDGSTI